MKEIQENRYGNNNKKKKHGSKHLEGSFVDDHGFFPHKILKTNWKMYLVAYSKGTRGMRRDFEGR